MKQKGVGAAAYIVDRAGCVLLVKHTYGTMNWELPGGIGEADESPDETAVREVREETGLAVTAEYMTGCYYSTENDSLHFVFLCKRNDPQQSARPDANEVSHCAYWDPDHLPRPISDWTVRRIADAREGNRFNLPLRIGPRLWLE